MGAANPRAVKNESWRGDIFLMEGMCCKANSYQLIAQIYTRRL